MRKLYEFKLIILNFIKIVNALKQKTYEDGYDLSLKTELDVKFWL